MFSFCNFVELFFLLCWRLFSSPVLMFLWFSGLFRVSARFFPSPFGTILTSIFITSRTWMLSILFSWLWSIFPYSIFTVLISVSVLIFRKRISSLSSLLFGITMLIFQICVCFLVSVIHDSTVTISFRRNTSVWSVFRYGISPIWIPWIFIFMFFWPSFSFSPCFLMPLVWPSFFFFPIMGLLFPDQFIYFFTSGVPLSLLSSIFSCMCKMK